MVEDKIENKIVIQCGKRKMSDVFSEVLEQFVSQLELMSEDGIRVLLTGIFDMLEEVFPEKINLKKIEILRDINKRISDQYLRRWFVDMLLRAEGYGQLPGFGFCSSFRDPLSGDPERQTYFYK